MSQTAIFHEEVRTGTPPALLGLAVATLLSAAILAVAHVVRSLTGVEGALLYRDANAMAGQPFYYGLLEYATASILLMSGAILAFETAKHRGQESLRGWIALLCLAGLTLLLGADDLLMLHESMPYVGLSPEHLLAVYAVLLAAILVFDPTEIVRPRIAVLAVGIIALGLAGIEDVFSLRPLGVGLEDYLEVVGFSFWGVYVVTRAAAR